MPRAALMYFADSGSTPTSPAIPEAQARLQFRCYGTTSAGAWTVFERLFEALHNKHHQTTAAKERMLTAYLNGGPTDTMEPQTEWPCVICWFVVRYVRETVT